MYRIVILAGLLAATLAPAAEPVGLEALFSGIRSRDLKASLVHLQEVQQLAKQGDYRLALQAADRFAHEVPAIKVTEEDLAARGAIALMFQAQAADMTALLGRTSEALSAYRMLALKPQPRDLKARLIEHEAFVRLLDLDLSGAASTERQAMSADNKAIQPILHGIATLYNGDPGPALSEFRRISSGDRLGYAYLYSAAAASCLGRSAEAESYFSRPETKDDASAVPMYHVIRGLLAAADGNLQDAKHAFDEAAGREHGRYRQGTVLSAVADLAQGNLGAAGTLTQALNYAPDNFRLIAADLLRPPSATRAAAALKTTRYWFDLRGYQPGELLNIPDAAAAPPTPPAPPEPQAPAAPAAPSTTPAPAAAQGSSGGGGEAMRTPEGPSGIELRALSTEAAQGYQAALVHLRAGRMDEAEAGLRGSLHLYPLAEAWLALGQVRLCRGAAALAATDFRNAVAMRPDWPDALYCLGQAEEQLGHTAQAAAAYRAALKCGLAEPLAGYARSRVR